MTSIFFRSKPNEGGVRCLLPLTPTNDWSQPFEKPQHMCELSPPTVPIILPTLIVLDLLKLTHTHKHTHIIILLNASNGSRTLTAYARARNLCTTRHAIILRPAHEWASNE